MFKWNFLQSEPLVTTIIFKSPKNVGKDLIPTFTYRVYLTLVFNVSINPIPQLSLSIKG
jgi:hypothetical protein